MSNTEKSFVINRTFFKFWYVHSSEWKYDGAVAAGDGLYFKRCPMCYMIRFWWLCWTVLFVFFQENGFIYLFTDIILYLRNSNYTHSAILFLINHVLSLHDSMQITNMFSKSNMTRYIFSNIKIHLIVIIWIFT